MILIQWMIGTLVLFSDTLMAVERCKKHLIGLRGHVIAQDVTACEMVCLGNGGQAVQNIAETVLRTRTCHTRLRAGICINYRNTRAEDTFAESMTFSGGLEGMMNQATSATAQGYQYFQHDRGSNVVVDAFRYTFRMGPSGKIGDFSQLRDSIQARCWCNFVLEYLQMKTVPAQHHCTDETFYLMHNGIHEWQVIDLANLNWIATPEDDEDFDCVPSTTDSNSPRLRCRSTIEELISFADLTARLALQLPPPPFV